MNPSIHFEQFVEELRLQFPEGKTIWATEKPLQVCIDGKFIDPIPLLDKHQPFWIRAHPDQIHADGEDASLVRIESPGLAGKEITLTIRHGDTILTEDVLLDTAGTAELEICTQTTGSIIFSSPSFPVRASITSVK